MSVSLDALNLSLLASLVDKRGEVWLRDKTNVDLSKYKSEVEITEEDRQRLANFEDFLRALSSDVSEARTLELELTKLSRTSWLQKNVAPLLAIIAVVSTFALFYLMVFVRSSIDQSIKEIALYVLGVLSTIASQIFGYYFGSSAGSRTKQEQLFKKMNQ